MKKAVIAVIAVVSATMIFAAEGNGMMKGFRGNGGNMGCIGTVQQGPMNDGRGMMGAHGGFGHGILMNDEVKKALLDSGVSQENINKAETLIKDFTTFAEKQKLAIAQKDLDLKKLELETNKNWTEIEKNVYDSAKLRAEVQVKSMKLKEDLNKLIPEKAQADAAKKIMNNYKGKVQGE